MFVLSLTTKKSAQISKVRSFNKNSAREQLLLVMTKTHVNISTNEYHLHTA